MYHCSLITQQLQETEEPDEDNETEAAYRKAMGAQLSALVGALSSR